MSEQPNDGVIAVYSSMEEIDEALRRLADEGIPTENMSVMTQNLESISKVHGFVTTGDVARSGAGWGAWIGGFFGLVTGVALLIIPGAGPVLVAGPAAAWILATLEGAGGGAILGGLVGGVVGHFVKDKHIPKYENHLKGGKYLLVAHGEQDVVDRAQKVLDDTEAFEVERHTA
jgi:hypothetical protein